MTQPTVTIPVPLHGVRELTEQTYMPSEDGILTTVYVVRYHELSPDRPTIDVFTLDGAGLSLEPGP